MTQDVESVLTDTLDQSCIALFEHYNVNLTPDSSETMSPQMVAVIGFSGDELRGAMGIVISPELVAEIRPIQLVGEDEDQALDDWIGEVANQLLGRIKNSLLGWGHDIALATPMVLRGVQMRLVNNHNIIHRNYSANGLNASFWLQVEYPEGLTLTFSEDEDQQIAAEGGLLLF